jgi:hypothetical protein
MTAASVDRIHFEGDSFISPERESGRFAPIRRIAPESVVSNLRTFLENPMIRIMNDLDRTFTIEDEKELRQLIESAPSAVQEISELNFYIRKHFPESSEKSMLRVSDDEDRVFLTVITRLPAQEVAALKLFVFNDWLSEKDRAPQNVAFSVRIV